MNLGRCSPVSRGNPRLPLLLLGAALMGVAATPAHAQQAGFAAPGATAAATGAEEPAPAFGLRGRIIETGSLPSSVSNKAAQREERALRVEADKIRAAKAEEDPWAPLGIRAGSFILYPSVEIGAGYTTNAPHTAGGGPSATTTVTPKLLVQSDWNRHEATLTLRGVRTEFHDGVTLPDTSASVEATGRIDISRDWQAKLNAAYYLTHQSPSDTGFPAGADDKPAVHTINAGGEITKAIGPATLTLAATAERNQYDPAHSGMVVIDQGDRDNTLYQARIRGGYAISPMTTPFIEIGGGRRIYDRAVDGNGFERDATVSFLRGGIAYDSSPVLKGEIAVGYRQERRDDPQLPDLGGFTVDATATWSPTRLITIDLRAGTSFNPIADPNSAGSVTYDAGFDVAYLFRHNITLHAIGNIAAERFQGPGANVTYQIGGGFDWKINRMIVLTSRFTHEWTNFANPAENYTAEVVTVGLRLQK